MNVNDLRKALAYVSGTKEISIFCAGGEERAATFVSEDRRHVYICDSAAEASPREKVLHSNEPTPDPDCICRAPAVHAGMTEPPEVARDKWCPIHGIDPDEARDRKMDMKNDR